MSTPIDPDAPSGSGVAGGRALVAVAVGGMMGTVSRFGISRAMSTAPGSIPWSIFVVNVVGSLALGFVLQLILERWPTDEFIRPFVAVGFIGSFTTFSTVMVDADLLIRDGHAGTAALYLGTSVVAGLAAAFSGVLIARRLGSSQESASC